MEQLAQLQPHRNRDGEGMTSTIIAMVTILLLAFIQNISFSIVSRSPNRNNMRYHLIAAFFSNTIWFITFRQLVKADMTLLFFAPYCCGTMLGSVFGVKISMWIEGKLGAAADGHLVAVKDSGPQISEVTAYLFYCGTPSRPQDRDLHFQEWLNEGKPDSHGRSAHKDDLMCPVCKINPIDANRDGTCVDCSH